MTTPPEQAPPEKLIQRHWLGISLDLWLAALVVGQAICLGYIALGFQPMANKMTAFLWALACLGVGSLIGFIFGVPRAIDQGVNTNIEQISDWLTKILVGASLVNLQHLPGQIASVGGYVAKGLDSSKDLSQFAAALIVFFSVEGFLGGYLMTRMFMGGAFRRADIEQEASTLPIFDSTRAPVSDRPSGSVDL